MKSRRKSSKVVNRTLPSGGRRLCVIVCAMLAFGGGIFSHLQGETRNGVAPIVTTDDGFAIPQPGHVFGFPRDHGSPPEFKLEWWYITGHLLLGNGRRLGFQATYFRQSAPREEGPGNSSSDPFSHDQIYLGHFALLDTATGAFIHQSRLNRSGWDAGAATNRLEVWNGNWRLKGHDAHHPEKWGEASQLDLDLAGTIRGDATLALKLSPTQPMVIFGTNGVSRKADGPTAASYYLTFPRLAVSGSVDLRGEHLPVTGDAWMDHEVSSSQLGANQVGWDWACLQLNDGRSIMCYRMRQEGGKTDPNSSLTWIEKSGELTAFGPSQFSWTALQNWKSPQTAADYPNHVRLETLDPATGKTTQLELEPLVENQELTDDLGGIAYWEGACRVKNSAGTEIGHAFLELTGYTGNLADRLK